MQKTVSPYYHNAHLDGDPFFEKAGQIGVLLIHGFTATPAEVRLFANALKQDGYTVAAPLLPGHAGDPYELNRIQWPQWLAEVEKAYQNIKQECDQVIVAGESFGGVLALHLAADHPEIKAVLTFAPAVLLTLNWIDRIRLHLGAPFIAFNHKKNMDNADWQGYSVFPLKGVIQVNQCTAAVRKKLDKIHQPLLVVLGKYDKTVSAEVGRYLLEHVSSDKSELITMQNSGHVILVDQEKEKAWDIARDFIKGLDLDN